MRRLILLALMLLALPCSALGATIFAIEGYYKETTSCSDVDSGDTAGDLEAALTAAGASGTLNICAGIYSNTEIDSDYELNITNDGQTINGIGDVYLQASDTKNATNDWGADGTNKWQLAVSTEVGFIFLNDTTVATRVKAESAMDAQGEFFYDYYEQRLKFYSVGNPATYYDDIKVCIDDIAIIQGDNGKDNITINNINVRYSSYIGIEAADGADSSDDWTITDSTVSYIGGGVGTKTYGSNLVVNGDMEAGDPPNNWNQVATPDTWESATPGSVCGGVASAHVDGQTAWDGIKSDAFSVVADQLYYVTACIWLVDSTDPDRVRVKVFDGDGTSTAYQAGYTLAVGEWVTVFQYFYANVTGALATLQIDNNGVDQEWYVDDAEVKTAALTRRGNGIQFWENHSNALVENCMGWQIYDAPFTSQGLAASVTMDATYRNNLAWDNWQGFEWFSKGLTPTTSMDIYNNTFYNNGAGWSATQRWAGSVYGSAISMPTGGAHTADVDIRNNIMYGADEYLIVIANANDPNNGLTLTNNSWYMPNDSDYAVRWGPGSPSAYTYGGGGDDLAQFQIDTSLGADLVKGDPLFINASAGTASGFKLTANSPCIDAGADLSGTFTTDYYGRLRPKGSAFDIGAFEHYLDNNHKHTGAYEFY